MQSVAVAAAGVVAASDGWRGVITSWDMGSGRVLQPVEAHGFWVTSLAFTPDGKTPVSGSAGRQGG